MKGEKEVRVNFFGKLVDIAIFVQQGKNFDKRFSLIYIPNRLIHHV